MTTSYYEVLRGTYERKEGARLRRRTGLGLYVTERKQDLKEEGGECHGRVFFEGKGKAGGRLICALSQKRAF